MKRLAVVALILGLALIIPAVGQDTTVRPDGVSASEWVPISDNLGLVVVSQWPRTDSGPRIGSPQALIVTPPMNGYFMVKRGRQWTRLIVLEPVRG